MSTARPPQRATGGAVHEGGGDSVTSSSAQVAGRGASPREAWRLGAVRACWTGRSDGDLGPGVEPALRLRRERAVVALPWRRCRQVHGAGVLAVTGGTELDTTAGQAGPFRPPRGSAVAAGEREGGGGRAVPAFPVADALVGDVPGMALAVAVADCGPVALASGDGIMGVAHAGWRGVLAGVLPSAVAAMRALGARDVVAALGPCVHPCCYPFGREELAVFAGRFGRGVVAEDAEGRPALDLPSAIEASLRRSGVALAVTSPTCTACGGRHFSHRRDRTLARNALAVWLA